MSDAVAQTPVLKYLGGPFGASWASGGTLIAEYLVPVRRAGRDYIVEVVINGEWQQSAAWGYTCRPVTSQRCTPAGSHTFRAVCEAAQEAVLEVEAARRAS